MAFDLGSIFNGVANGLLPGVASGGGYVATEPPLTHEPVHAHLAGSPDSNPAAGAERQGIIIIGGDLPLHPAVAAASGHPQADPTKPDTWYASQSAPRLLTDLVTRLGSMAHEMHKAIAGNLRA